jgi:hypothetical protein
MSKEVSLWGNFVKGAEYPDEILFETENTLIIKYCGQNSGQHDKLVGIGNYFFIKKSNNQPSKYTFVGRVIKSTHLGKEWQYKKHNKTKEYNYYNIQTFELVISKEPIRSFHNKDEVYTHFKWDPKKGNRQSGIIEHTLL